MTIRISDRLSDLTATGIEYLTDKTGNVLAVFYNGNFITVSPSGNDDVTKLN